jgi:hypothetical protein
MFFSSTIYYLFSSDANFRIYSGLGEHRSCAVVVQGRWRKRYGGLAQGDSFFFSPHRLVSVLCGDMATPRTST